MEDDKKMEDSPFKREPTFAQIADFPMLDEEEDEEEEYLHQYDNIGGDEEEDGVPEEDSDEMAKSLKKSNSRIRFPKFKKTSKFDKERKEILLEAKRLGESRTHPDERRITIIYNPVSGSGKAKRLVKHLVVPVLDLCKMKYTLMETQHRGHAIEYMRDLDPTTTEGIIIAGGDGLVHEVITGYFLNPNEAIREIPVGVTPSGTANAMAHELHSHPSKSQISIVMRAALAVCKGHTRSVDVFKVHSIGKGDDEDIYALSVFGWGLAGAVALKADKLRWIPGQKKARYDIAGAVTMLRDWPVIDSCEFEYLKEVKNPLSRKKHTSWVKKDISCINMVATNLPFLGSDHPIYEHIGPDDGYVAVVFVKGKSTRLDVIKLARDMKKGIFLANDKKRCELFYTTEFKITPTKATSPFNIDGDPHDHCAVHVKMLPKALKMFTLPERGDNITERMANLGMPVPLAVAGVSTHDMKAGAKSKKPQSATEALAMGMFGDSS